MIHSIQRALDAIPCVVAHGVRVVSCGDGGLRLMAHYPPSSRDALGRVSTASMFALAEVAAQVAAQLEAGKLGRGFRQKSARIKYYGSTKESLCADVGVAFGDAEGGGTDLRVEVALVTDLGQQMAQYDAHFTL